MKFVFLYQGGRAPQDKMEEYMQAWGTWNSMLQQKGIVKTGVRVRGEKTVSAKGVHDYTGEIGGVSIIEVESLKEAEEIAEGCPSLPYGGTVAVLKELPM